MQRRWMERSILLFAIAILAAACGTGKAGQGGHGDRGEIPNPGSVGFTKYDGAPDFIDMLGVQAVVWPTPPSTLFENHDPEVIEVDEGLRMWVTRNDGDAIISLVNPSGDGISWENDSSMNLLPGLLSKWENGRVAEPAVVEMAGTLMMWYRGGDGAGIGLAVSEGGGGWLRVDGNTSLPGVDPVLVPTVSWEDGYVGAPTVIYDTDVPVWGRYRMWYEFGCGSGVAQAYSEDGIYWIKEDGDPETGNLDPALQLGDPGAWDSEFVGDPEVIKETTALGRPLYKMWFTGADETNISIGSAQSYDGRTWEKFDYNPVLDEFTLLFSFGVFIKEMEPAVLGEDNYYRMWFAQFQGLPTGQGIALATQP